MPAIILLLLIGAGLRADTVSPLGLRGYSVVPQPQRVEISPQDLRFGAEWSLESGPGLDRGDVDIETLDFELRSRFGLRRTASAADSVRLAIVPGAVPPGKSTDPDKQGIAEQAYRIEIKEHRIVITANAPPARIALTVWRMGGRYTRGA